MAIKKRGINVPAKTTRWKPKVVMLKELIRWTPKGPIGGVPGHWTKQATEAYHGWLDELPPGTQGVFFLRHGKVWGVLGPHEGSAESLEMANLESVSTTPKYSRPFTSIRFSVSSASNANLSNQLPAWIDKAKQTIFEWEKKASWVPEIGFIEEKNAWGVIPPKDGRPKNWMTQAKALFEEHQLEKELERKAREEAQKQPLKSPSEENVEKGYLSPRWDHVFNEIGASKNARVAYDFMDRCWRSPGLDSHLQGIVELLRNPKDLRFGYTRQSYFKFLTDLFSKTMFWLELIHRAPETGDEALDKKLAEWSGTFLAEHSGDVVRGWNQFNEAGRSENSREAARCDDHFLAKALRGYCSAENGARIAFSPADPRHFRRCFDAQRHKKRRNTMRWFAEHCLSRAGYLKGTASVRRHHRAMQAYDAKKEAVRSEGLPWEPLADSKSSSLMNDDNPPLEKLTFPRMNEDELCFAWDRNGKSLSELKRLVATHEKKCSWDSLDHYELVTKAPLPIKAVMQRELPMLQRQFESEERKKTRSGKRENGAKYLSDVEPHLRLIVRELVGLSDTQDS